MSDHDDDIRLAKQLAFELALAIGGAVRIRCDGTRCDVPAPHSANENLVLKFNRETQIDEDLGDGIKAFVSFAGANHHIEVPWDAVGMVWEDAPASRVLLVMPCVEAAATEVKPEPVKVEPAPAKKARPAWLSVVPDAPARHPSCLSDCNAAGCTGGCRT